MCSGDGREHLANKSVVSVPLGRSGRTFGATHIHHVASTWSLCLHAMLSPEPRLSCSHPLYHRRSIIGHQPCARVGTSVGLSSRLGVLGRCLKDTKHHTYLVAGVQQGRYRNSCYTSRGIGRRPHGPRSRPLGPLVGCSVRSGKVDQKSRELSTMTGKVKREQTQEQKSGPDCVVERKWKVEMEALQRWGSWTELREAVIGCESICLTAALRYDALPPLLFC
jgi:hypothetical protein